MDHMDRLGILLNAVKWMIESMAKSGNSDVVSHVSTTIYMCMYTGVVLVPCYRLTLYCIVTSTTTTTTR